MTVARSRYALAWLCLSACARATPPPRTSLPLASSAAPLARSQAIAVPVAAAAPPAPPAAPRACGAFDCLAFQTPEAAFEYVILSQPRILAVGEAHAQQGMAGISSSTRRFAEHLLPLLSGKARHIVIELLLANCKQPTVTGVAQAQAPVIEQQAQSNQAEFLTLGKYAKRLGIEPQALTPSCAEYDAVGAAGEDGVARLLSLVAEQTSKSVESLLSQPESPASIILTYGGALHNDLYPRKGQEDWSFGPRLAAASQGRYVELDLIVPEFVKDSEAWRNLPWFQAFDREHLVSETLLYRPAPNSFALIFPKTDATARQGL